MPTDMPPNVRAVLEQHPDLAKTLTDPDFLAKLNQGLTPGLRNADWCVACGASAAAAPMAAVSNPNPLTQSEIEAMGQRLLSHAATLSTK